MTTYKEIFGKPVKVLSSEPSNETEGQVWYNTTSGAFKAGIGVGAWASGGNLNAVGRAGGSGSVGTQTAGLAFGGEPITGATEEYNGSSWTTGGSLNTARRNMGGCGTQTASLASAGNTSGLDVPTTASEEYNGSSWTSGNSVNGSRYVLSSAGIQTAAVTFGGSPSPFVRSEEYDGTSYTSGNSLNDTHWAVTGCGTQTAGIAVGGGPSTPAFSTAVEEYNGTSWTAVTSTPVGAGYAGIAGVQTSLILQVGAQAQPSLYNTTTLGYDGTNWFTQPSIATGRFDLKGSGGTATAAYIAGGAAAPGNTTATEEFTVATGTKTLTSS